MKSLSNKVCRGWNTGRGTAVKECQLHSSHLSGSITAASTPCPGDEGGGSEGGGGCAFGSLFTGVPQCKHGPSDDTAFNPNVPTSGQAACMKTVTQWSPFSESTVLVAKHSLTRSTWIPVSSSNCEACGGAGKHFGHAQKRRVSRLQAVLRDARCLKPLATPCAACARVRHLSQCAVLKRLLVLQLASWERPHA